MPRNQYNYPQTARRINWIAARFQYFNPTKSVCTHYCFYDKKTGIDLSYKSAFVKLSSAKGQVTKIKNAIESAKAAFMPTLFVKQLEDTDEYKRAIEKLNTAQAEVFRYKALVDEELQKLNRLIN
uniref:hypothetical protein n=1 Tax=Runella zeae TaxID=94255 RepID=UPI00048AF05A|nr:hypothetical protein [Runella zeae]